ncbi:MAG: NAD(P)/FAD-dependent oxidoreductase [Clostridia bacterium]|nr:NAD(P)/FAD-dependent oxidoreductase [Clostridia bacterium]
MNVCVIGGGASGSLCAIKLADYGHKVTLYEKNEKIGKKLYITGKGRCNLTNATTGNEFLSHVVNGSKFMMSAETRFNSTDTMELFKSFGVPLKVERGNRVFPQSDKSSDIIAALTNALKMKKVKVVLGTTVQDIVTEEGKAVGVVVNNKVENYDAVVVATGGKSYAATGSTGDGYVWAQKTGHTIVEPVPSLVGIFVKDKDIFALEGLSLKNVTVSAVIDGKTIYKSPVGEMLFIDGGISGPIVISMSAYINRIDISNAKVYIDFKPALSSEQLHQRINREIAGLGAKQISSLLETLLPKSLCGIVANRIGVLMEDKANQMSATQRDNLVNTLKHFDLSIDHLEGFERAVITSGGVSTKQVSPRNMQSKLIKNLYFIGEVLDIDALTGGFNLQLAFSTAVACASDLKENN